MSVIFEIFYLIADTGIRAPHLWLLFLYFVDICQVDACYCKYGF